MGHNLMAFSRSATIRPTRSVFA